VADLVEHDDTTRGRVGRGREDIGKIGVQWPREHGNALVHSIGAEQAVNLPAVGDMDAGQKLRGDFGLIFETRARLRRDDKPQDFARGIAQRGHRRMPSVNPDLVRIAWLVALMALPSSALCGGGLVLGPRWTRSAMRAGVGLFAHGRRLMGYDGGLRPT